MGLRSENRDANRDVVASTRGSDARDDENASGGQRGRRCLSCRGREIGKIADPTPRSCPACAASSQLPRSSLPTLRSACCLRAPPGPRDPLTETGCDPSHFGERTGMESPETAARLMTPTGRIGVGRGVRRKTLPRKGVRRPGTEPRESSPCVNSRMTGPVGRTGSSPSSCSCASG